MSRLEVGILDRKLRGTGDIALRAEIDLLLKSSGGIWRPRTFRVDSGTEMTTMQANEAKFLGLPIPLQPTPGTVLRGQAVRPGYLRVQVLGMDGTEYAFPCYFLGDPNAPIITTSPGGADRRLLGLTGVIDKVRILFDGTPKPGAANGNLVIEKL